jgi:AAT family amino acid transporter/D-serine/D-alanine/glycine transporter
VFPNGLSGFAHALPIALFAFGGFEIISLASADSAEPEKAIPAAINGLILRFVIFYLGATCALLVLLPWSEMTPGTSPFVVILQRLHVPGAAILLELVLITAILSSCNSVIFAGARTLRALARASDAPASLARLNRANAPATGAALTAAAMSLAVGLNIFIPRAIFGLLMELVAVVTVMNWGLIVLAELAFRRRSAQTKLPRFAAPYTPWANLLVFVFIVAVLIISLSS